MKCGSAEALLWCSCQAELTHAQRGAFTLLEQLYCTSASQRGRGPQTPRYNADWKDGPCSEKLRMLLSFALTDSRSVLAEEFRLLFSQLGV